MRSNYQKLYEVGSFVSHVKYKGPYKVTFCDEQIVKLHRCFIQFKDNNKIVALLPGGEFDGAPVKFEISRDVADKDLVKIYKGEKSSEQ